jgi:hypothetical protein
MPYADTIRTSSPTFENVASLIDGQLISYSAVEVDSVQTYTVSGTITGSSITLACAAGEAVLLLANVTVSHSTLNADMDLRVQKNGSNIGGAYGYSRAFRANTSGLDQQLVHHVIDLPSAGTHTYSLRMSVGTATLYTRGVRFSAIKFRNS